MIRPLWPAAPDLIALTAAAGPGLPLFDSRGHLVGHLAALHPDPSRRAPRVAATNVERWAASL